jgi:RIP metalloprotease RseP
MSNISKLFSDGITDVIAVSIVLGIMIFVHEWGHFIAAKLSGVRVEVFSLGFGTRLFGVKRGDTDYRLSALPFGGYVRMSGPRRRIRRSANTAARRRAPRRRCCVSWKTARRLPSCVSPRWCPTPCR